MSAFSANLPGTPAYWGQRAEELDAIMQQKQPATVWFTHSAAANHWEDLSRLMPEGLMSSTKWAAQASRNPHIVDWLFSQNTNVLDLEWTWHRYEYQHGTTVIHAHGFGAAKNDPGLFKLAALAYKAYRLGSADGNVEEPDLPEEEMEQIHLQGVWAEELLVWYADTMINECNPRTAEKRADKAGVYRILISVLFHSPSF
ncbi:hypothetical protein BCR33DRAFT_845310 [Rhizoclosmatium globosum]|uniref:Helitron helicase-like domain-containing protein n=1 Tax=Rhizoclosmatium globosum TaxID=329046 RepID=A0A1Y2D1B0_9FUNG|nr:hypothetical protein BCR33DRAFT_845310 [Rhizoclosmatium globosum]|eukprot:ORY53071.1 hypothetical protein BCR33DRAFT_845310 [Rhizoclosmatium globosum]